MKNKRTRSIDCLFRLDAGPKVGMGHLRRCLVLAERLKERGVRNIQFASKTPKDISGFVGKRFPVISLSSNNTSKSEVDLLKAKLRNCRVKLVIVDHYRISASSLKKIEKEIAPAVVFDDYLHLSHYPVSGIINHNLGAEKYSYKTGSKTNLFLGARFTLISKEFLKERKKNRVSDKETRLFVSLGASPNKKVLDKVLAAIRGVEKNLKVSLVLGPHYPDRNKYKSSGVSLVPPRGIAQAMRQCTYALSAAGVTSYELAYMKIPSLLVVLVDNQLRIAKEMHCHGVAKNLGWLKVVSASKLATEINKFVDEKTNKKNFNFKIINGKGSDCLSKLIVSKYLRGIK